MNLWYRSLWGRATGILPDALMDMLESVSGPLRRLLVFLRHTGCRPAEARHAHARNVTGPAIIFAANPAPGEWRWKNAKKTKRDRVIYLTHPEVAAMAVEADGYILLTERGRGYSPANLRFHMEKVKADPKVSQWCEENNFDVKGVMPYSYRHTYITNALKRGMPIKLLADVCGTSVAMIEKHYSKAANDVQAMFKLLQQFV